MTFKDNIGADAAFCAKHKKAKNGQDYIPWAILLAEARQRHPDLECGYGPIVSHQGMVGLIVEASARVGNGPAMTAQLAVTDMRNKTIERPTADAVQNAQQRALAKAVSMATGIGLSLWFGDVQAPTGEAPQPVSTREQNEQIRSLLNSLGLEGHARMSRVSMIAARAVSAESPLTREEADRVVAALRQQARNVDSSKDVELDDGRAA